MLYTKKILLTASATIWLLSTGSLVLYGQNKIRQLHAKHPITIGFDVEKSTFDSPPILAHKKIKWTQDNNVYLKTPVNKHIQAQLGVTFTTSPIQTYLNKETGSKYFLAKYQPLSIPFTMQYYPLHHHCKVQPHIGVGIQYNCKSFNTNISPANDGNNNYSNVNNGTKYVSIIFAQGVTYEVNTKIQVTQSFHFIPETTHESIGFGIGIGYKLP